MINQPKVTAAPTYDYVFEINDLRNEADGIAGDGVCQTAVSRNCTFRAAVEEINRLSPNGEKKILVKPAAQMYDQNGALVTQGDISLRAPRLAGNVADLKRQEGALIGRHPIYAAGGGQPGGQLEETFAVKWFYLHLTGGGATFDLQNRIGLSSFGSTFTPLGALDGDHHRSFMLINGRQNTFKNFNRNFVAPMVTFMVGAFAVETTFDNGTMAGGRANDAYNFIDVVGGSQGTTIRNVKFSDSQSAAIGFLVQGLGNALGSHLLWQPYTTDTFKKPIQELTIENNHFANWYDRTGYSGYRAFISNITGGTLVEPLAKWASIHNLWVRGNTFVNARDGAFWYKNWATDEMAIELKDLKFYDNQFLKDFRTSIPGQPSDAVNQANRDGVEAINITAQSALVGPVRRVSYATGVDIARNYFRVVEAPSGYKPQGLEVDAWVYFSATPQDDNDNTYKYGVNNRDYSNAIGQVTPIARIRDNIMMDRRLENYLVTGDLQAWPIAVERNRIYEVGDFGIVPCGGESNHAGNRNLFFQRANGLTTAGQSAVLGAPISATPCTSPDSSGTDLPATDLYGDEQGMLHIKNATIAADNFQTWPITVNVFVSDNQAGAEKWIGSFQALRPSDLAAEHVIPARGITGTKYVRFQTTDAVYRTSRYSHAASAIFASTVGPDVWVKQGGWYNDGGTIETVQKDPTSTVPVSFDLASGGSAFGAAVTEDMISFRETDGWDKPTIVPGSLRQTSPNTYSFQATRPNNGTITPYIAANLVTGENGAKNNEESNTQPGATWFTGTIDNIGTQVPGAQIDNQVTVNLPLQPLDKVVSTYSVSTGEKPASGTDTHKITVNLTNQAGQPASNYAANLTATGTPTGATVSEFKETAPGVYEATITSTTPNNYEMAAVVTGAPNGDDPDGRINLVTNQNKIAQFVALQVDPATSLFAVSTGDQVADGVAKHTVTATLKDQFGNLITDADLTKFVTTAGAAKVGAWTKTDQPGVYTAPITSTVAGVQQVAVTYDTKALNGTDKTASFVPGPVDATKSTITVDPLSIAADNTDAATATVVLKDKFGNVITNPTSAVTIAVPGLTVGDVVKQADGTFKAPITAPVGTPIGEKTVSFAVDGTTSPNTAKLTVTAGAANANTSTLLIVPNSLEANGVAKAIATLAVLDASGAPVANAPVTWTVPGDVTASTKSTTTGPDGKTSIELTSTKAGTYPIGTAVDGVPLKNANVTFVAGIPVVEGTLRSTFAVTDTANKVANGQDAQVATVVLKDAQGNPVTGKSQLLVGQVSTGAAITSFTEDSTQPGTYTANVTSTKAGEISVSAVYDPATANVAIGSGVTHFVPGAPVAGSPSTFVVTPDSGVVADGVGAYTATVTLKDANGNPVKAGVPVVFDAASGITPDKAGPYLTDDNGQVVVKYTATKAGSYPLKATYDGAQIGGDKQLTYVAGPADATKSTIAANPTEVTANGTSASTITVKVMDANGNPVTTNSDVVLASTLGNLGDVTNLGNGTYEAKLTSSQQGTATVTYTVNGDAGTGSATVNFVSGSVNVGKSTYAVTTGTKVADGAAAHQITIEPKDANGNVIKGLTASAFAVAAAPNEGVTIGSVTETSPGVYQAEIKSTKSGDKVISVVVQGETLTTTANKTASFVPGAASTTVSTFSVTPGSDVPADGKTPYVAVVTVKDTNGNPIPNAPVTLVPAAGLTPDQAGPYTTGPDGTVTVKYTATEAKSYPLEAKVDTGSLGTKTLTYVPGAVDLEKSELTVSPAGPLTADGTAKYTLTVVLKDANGNLIKSNQPVSVKAAGVGRYADALAQQPDGSWKATYVSTTAGDVKFNLWVGSSEKTPSVDRTFVAGPVSNLTGTSAYSVTEGTKLADGFAAHTVTITAKDANGNLVSNLDTAKIVLTSAPADAAFGAIAEKSPGVYTASITAKVAGTKTISVTVDGVKIDPSGNNLAVFGAGDVVSAKSSFTLTSGDKVANGTDAHVVTIVLKDNLGNPVPKADLNKLNISVPGAIVDRSKLVESATEPGTYTVPVTATTAGSKTVSVTYNNITVPGPAPATINFVPDVAAANTSTIAVSPTSIPADGKTTATVTVTLKDANGNPVPATADNTVAITGTNGVSVSNVTKNPDGTYTATVTAPIGTNVGESTLSFTVNGDTSPNTAKLGITAGTPNAGQSTLTLTPAEQLADGVKTITATQIVKDVNGNVVPGAKVTWNIPGDVTASAATSTTGPDGVATITLTSTKAGSYPITTSANGAELNKATAKFIAGVPVVDPDGSKSTFTVTNTAGVTADGAASQMATIVLKDKFGNPVSGQAGLLSATADLTGVTVSKFVEHAKEPGTYLAKVTSTKAGETTLTGVFDPATANVTIGTAKTSFVAGTPSATVSTFEVTGSNVVANGVDAYTATVTVKDANGNPVAAGTPVTFDAASGITPDQAGPYTTDVNGKVVVQYTATKAGDYSLVAKVDGTQIGNDKTLTYVAGPAVAGKSTIEASPTTVVADGVAASVITVKLFDNFGNPVTADTPVKIYTTGGDQLQVTKGAGNTYTANLTSATAGPITVEYNVNGAKGEGSVTVNFIAGTVNAAKSAFAVSTGDKVADGVATHTVTITAKDSSGNPVPELQRGDFALTADPADGVAFADTVTDKGNGIYTITLTSTKAGIKTIGATINGSIIKGNPNTATFVAGAFDAVKSTVVVTPDSGVIANGTDAYTATVTVKDANGNPIKGATVEIPAVAGLTTDPSGTTFTTDENGQVVVKATSTAAGTYPLEVKVGGEPVDPAKNLVFVAGPADMSKSVFTVTPAGPLTANGQDAYTATVMLKDANGNPVTTAGDLVIWDANRLTTGSALTPAAGGGFSKTFTSTAAGEALFKASVNGKEATPVSKMFVAGDVSTQDGRSTYSVTTGNKVADGVETHEITIVLKDAQGNSISGLASDKFTLSAVESDGVAFAKVTETATKGTYTATVTSTKAGVKNIRVTANNVALPVSSASTATFVAGPVDMTVSTISADPKKVLADGQAVTTVTITLKDAKGNPITGVKPSLALGNSQAIVTGTGVTEKGDGVYTATVADAKAETVNISFTAGGISANAPSVAVEFAAQTATPVEFVANGATASGYAEPGAKVEVKDANGNVLCTATAGSADADHNNLGKFTCQMNPVQANGTPVTATATGASGFPSDPATTLVDANKPTVDGTTNGKTASGQTEAGASVKVTDKDGKVLCTTTADNAGKWNCTLSPDQPDKTVLNAIATDKAGNPSDPYPMTVDRAKPDVPTDLASNGKFVTGKTSPNVKVDITDSTGKVLCTTTSDKAGEFKCEPLNPTVADGVTLGVTATAANGETASAPVVVDAKAPDAPKGVSDGTKAFGTAEKGATVDVYTPDGLTKLCTTTATAPADQVEGEWICTLSAKQPDGAELKATATDAVGNTSVPGTVVVDNKAPVVTGALASATQVFGPAGSVQPGSLPIKVVDEKGTVVCTTTANADGSFTCPLSSPLADGTPLKVIATGKTGLTGEQPVTVDAVAPAAPTGSGLVNPATGTAATVSGEAEPKATVKVYDKDGNLLCTEKASDDGKWACLMSTPQPEGAKVTATATDAVGNTSPAGNISIVAKPIVDPLASKVTVDPATLEVGQTANAQVKVVDAKGNPMAGVEVRWTVPGDVTPSQTTSTTGSDGTASITVTSAKPGTYQVGATAAGTPVTSALVEFKPKVVKPATPTDLVATPTTVTGKGGAEGDKITIKNPAGTVICETVVQKDLSFTCSIPKDAAPNVGDKLTVTASNGTGGVSDPATTTVIPNAPKPPTNLSATPDEIKGTAEPGSTVDVKNANGDVLCTTTADGKTGAFSCKPEDDKKPAVDDVISVTATNAGGTSTPSEVTVVAKPTTPRPTNLEAVPDVVLGNAPAGTTVKVKDPSGNVICTTTATDEGTFVCQPLNPIQKVGTELKVTATDPKTGESEATPVVVQPKPAPPAPATDFKATPTVATGKAEPGVTVTIKTEAGDVLCVTLAQADGTFTCTPLKDKNGNIPVVGDTVTATTSTVKGGEADPVETKVVPNPPKPPYIDRWRGPTAVDTSIAVAIQGYPDGAPVVYIANDVAFPDALAAGPAAANWQGGGPLILTNPKIMSDYVLTMIESLNPKHLVIQGGMAAISPAIEQQLKDRFPGVEILRNRGPQAIDTAVATSQQAFANGAPEVFIANDVAFQDALAAGPVAGRKASPILLVPTDGTVPSNVINEIKRLGAKKITLVGGRAALPQATMDTIARQTGAETIRVSGKTDILTSLAIANTISGTKEVFLANNLAFHDALGAGPVAAKRNGVLLLTNGKCMIPEVNDYIWGLPAEQVHVIGGFFAMSKAFMDVETWQCKP